MKECQAYCMAGRHQIIFFFNSRCQRHVTAHSITVHSITVYSITVYSITVYSFTAHSITIH